MIEKIGNVKLNLEYYPGEDLYSDGDVEEKILQIVKEHASEDYLTEMMDNCEWPVLYHLSRERQNILEWYPFEKTASVLEIGAGCGAISGCLCEKAKEVVAVELSKRRSLINANRNRKYENLEILVGNFNDIYRKFDRKFDYITLIGVLEYAACYTEAENPYATMLNLLNNLLEDNGKILIAIENRFGLKYFAGCKEDHLGTLFSGIQGYHNGADKVQTFNKRELEQLFESNGFMTYEFYYPYPDYKFANVIYSDKQPPKVGELTDNIRNFDANRMVLFDETRVYNDLIKSGMFPEFSNSYLIVLEKKG